MSSLLQNLKNIRQISEDDIKNGVHRRGALILGFDNNPYYIQIASTPETKGEDNRACRLKIDIFDTSLSRIHNYVYDKDQKSAVVIDSLTDSDKIGLSHEPVATLSATVMSGKPVVHELHVGDDYIRRGIGSLAIQLAEEIFAQAGYDGMFASKDGSKDAEYYPSNMRKLGRVGKAICSMVHHNREESNRSAYKEFLAQCGFVVGDHPFDFPHKYFKRIPPMNVKKRTGTILSPALLREQPPVIGERLSKAVYPSDLRDIKARGRYLTENTASLAIPTDENNVPRRNVTLQICDVTLPLDFIEEMTLSKYHKPE